MEQTWKSELQRERELERSRRLHGGFDSDPDESRLPSERDRDRVLYAAEFRRLAGITQVTAVHENHLLHNRMTHSLKVAQVACRIAERLLREHKWLSEPGNDLVLGAVETAGLAHDIGHPPFGHATERVLNRLLKDYGGFEGNAQTFRIVTKLAVRSHNESDTILPGLDLARVSLNAIQKYPQARSFTSSKDEPFSTDRSHGNKWGYYRTEIADFRFSRSSEHEPVEQISRLRSPCAIIMDWADDISFATHDVLDYIEAGLIRPERLLIEWQRFENYTADRLSEKGKPDTSLLGDAFAEVESALQASKAWPYDGSNWRRARLHEMIGNWLYRFDRACDVTEQGFAPFIQVSPAIQYEVEVLKKITDYYVVDSPALRAAELGQEKLICDLFDFLKDWLTKNPDRRGVPGVLLEHYDRCKSEDTIADQVSREEYALRRGVADYICTLSEGQVFDLCERMLGLSRASIFGAWFR